MPTDKWLELLEDYEPQPYSMWNDDSAWGEGGDGYKMARRITDSETPSWRGVMKLEHRTTGEITYKYIGPYANAGSVGGALTNSVNAHNSAYERESKYNRIDTKVIAVKRQKATVWEDHEEWKDV